MINESVDINSKYTNMQLLSYNISKVPTFVIACQADNKNNSKNLKITVYTIECCPTRM